MLSDKETQMVLQSVVNEVKVAFSQMQTARTRYESMLELANKIESQVAGIEKSHKTKSGK